MLNQLLHLDRPMFVVDCETTGIDVKQDRIVELAFEEWTEAGMVKEWRTLVNPGVPIPASATKVHGITDEKMQRCTRCHGHRDDHPVIVTGDRCEELRPVPTFKQLAIHLAKGFIDCDWAGQNVRFDLRILSAEFARSGVTWSYANARIIDTSILERLAVPRHLSDLYRKYTGAEHVDAHGALGDVKATVDVLVGQLSTYPMLPRDLDKLHAEQWPGWIDGEGSFRFVNGVATCQFGKWRGKSMRSIEASYWDWILKNDFSADVKTLASKAKLGEFPEGK